MRKNTDHPEVADIKNICHVSPKAKSTKNVCDKVNNDNAATSRYKNTGKKKDESI